MYLLKLILRPWKVAPGVQFVSAASIGIIIFMLGMAWWLDRASTDAIQKMKKEDSLTAYLEPSLSKKQVQSIVDEIHVRAGSSAVRNVELVSSTEFLTRLKRDFPRLVDQMSSFGQDLGELVPSFISIEGAIAPTAIDSIRSIEGIESLDRVQDHFEYATASVLAIRWTTKALFISLCIVLMTVCFQLSKSSLSIHVAAASLMRLFGSGSSETRILSIASSAITGLVSGVLAALLWVFLGCPLGAELQGLSPVLGLMPAPSPVFAIHLLGAGLIAGALAGMLVRQGPVVER